jgi:hypothetical protein
MVRRVISQQRNTPVAFGGLADTGPNDPVDLWVHGLVQPPVDEYSTARYPARRL